VQVESSPEIFFFFFKTLFREGDLEKSKKERRAKDVVIRVMEILLDDVMEKNSLEEKTSLSTQVGAPGPAAWASPPPTGGGTCSGPATGMDSTITTEPNQVMGLFACLTGCRCASEGTDVACLLTSCHLAGNAFENGRGLGEACDRGDACCELTAFLRRGCE
jgi:hypothetical protein